MTNYQTLSNSRSYYGKPHFWTPKAIKKVPHSLIFDEDAVCEESWGVTEAIQRTIALGLFLELPVGEWVLDGRKKETANLPAVALKLLQRNVSDEAKHDQGFKFAASAYPVSTEIMHEAELIAEQWIYNSSHPLEKARNAETGVFLAAGLATLRLCGGTSLAGMSESIAVDESDHVATNELVLQDLNMNPQNPNKGLRDLISDTLDWLMGDLSIPGSFIGESYNFDKAFVMEASDSLIETGIAKRLNSLLDIQVTRSPMEEGNGDIYNRETED